MLPAWSESCGMRISGARFGLLCLGTGPLEDLNSVSDGRLETDLPSLCISGKESRGVGGKVTLSLLRGVCADGVWVVGVTSGEVGGGSVGDKGTVIAGKMISFGSGLGLGTGDSIPGDRNPRLSWCSFCCYQK